MNIKLLIRSINISFLLLFFSMHALSQGKEQKLPQPEIIKPGEDWKAPSDAIVLFDGENLNKFESVDGGPTGWEVDGNYFTVKPGSGNIHSLQHFGNCQLHIEWRTPSESRESEGQKSGNSGIYLMGKYEVQVLNSYNNETYPDGQAGAIYRQHSPMVNASRKPGEWQVYDIVFYAPEFNDNGIETRKGHITVFHNGVLIHHNAAISGPTTAYNQDIPDDASEGPLMLQDHTNKVSFRNIWIRELNQ